MVDDLCKMKPRFFCLMTQRGREESLVQPIGRGWEQFRPRFSTERNAVPR
jgi:hypothetical protein